MTFYSDEQKSYIKARLLQVSTWLLVTIDVLSHDFAPLFLYASVDNICDRNLEHE